MSVMSKNKVDATAITSDHKCLILSIDDNLDWKNEKSHLQVLQEKLDAYVGFIDTKQYSVRYPDIEFEEIIIEVRFKKHPIPEQCVSFLTAVNKQLAPLKTKCKIIEVNKDI